MSSIAIFAASRGLQFAGAANQAYKKQLFSQLQADMTNRRMEEIDARADIAVRNTQRAGTKAVAAQKAAFIKSGVKLEGSSMEVISNTLSDAAEAAAIRRQEADFDLIQAGADRQALIDQGSDEALRSGVLAAGLGAGAGFAGDYYNYNRGSLRDRGAGAAKGLGD